MAEPRRRGELINQGAQALTVAAGAAIALYDAASLYNRREGMAGQFQEQITFPFDLIRTDAGRNFYMGFTFQKYVKRSITNSPFLRTEGKIRLPIPDGIKDNMSVSYDSPSLSAAVGAGLDSLAASGQNGSFESVAGTISAGISTGAAVAAGSFTTFAQGLAPGVASAASALSGTAVNPYQTVLFKNPDFKNHNFSWRFMPRDEDESNRVRKIFRTFQHHMLPGVSAMNGLFFSYPSMVIVSLFPSSEFLYRFKPCVVKSVNIDYSAGSSPSFFRRTAAPTSMSISIELQEIEYWTNSDYTAATFSDGGQLQGANRQSQEAQRLANNTRLSEITPPPNS